MNSSSDDEVDKINGNTIDPSYLVESHIFDKNRFGFCTIEDGEKEIDFVNVKVIDIFENKLYSGQL
jgi:valyl-tRNA synthetase